MIRLLFIQGGSRWKFDTDGNVYTDSNFNEHVWDRYRAYCDHLTVILRREAQAYSPEEARTRFNIFDAVKSSCVSLPDIYRPVSNYLRPAIHKQIKAEILKQVDRADLVIIRSVGNYYVNAAVSAARRLNKPCLIEVTGFIFENLWYHNLLGKLTAIPNELRARAYLKSAPYAVYVTGHALQARYPCGGRSIGCSDVELPPPDERVLEARLRKIRNNPSGRLILGTAAFLNVKWKGQEYVIRALAELKRQGISNIEYRLIGAGSGEKLIELSRRLGIDDEVHIMGALPHDEVFAWLDDIDVYIQPSFQEGLCRAIVEALSRACPVLASDVGGNSELVSPDCLFRAGKVRQIAERIRRMMDPEIRAAQAAINFERARAFGKESLDAKRDAFYRGFVEDAVVSGQLNSGKWEVGSGK